jgi:hypothetical protein
MPLPPSLPWPLRPIPLSWRPIAGLLLGSSAALAQAGVVEVRFVDPAHYSDVRDAHFPRADIEQPLAAHLQGLGDKLLAPEEKLEIEVTDVDLAGEIEPVGPRLEQVRVMRSHTWPRMTLRYTLRDRDGTALRSAELRLSDMNYLDNARPVSAGDPLRYEKQMLSDWFRREFNTSHSADAR